MKRLIETALNLLPAAWRNAFWVWYCRDENIPALRLLAQNRFAPEWIIDCGAFRGNWTRLAKSVFPASKVLMVEAQSSKQKLLEQVSADFDGTAQYAITLLGPEEKSDVPFFEMGTGSSVLEELTDLPRKPTLRNMRTLDGLLREKGIAAPSLIKLDLQGFEIEALKGATQALEKAEVVFLETSLVAYNKGAPLFDEVMAFLKTRGFLLYDCRNLNRWRGGDLFQLDAVFVKANSPLRVVDFRTRTNPA
ncbi:MAG: FkbM family methyltransferase [Verrucomicrobia bacterium]|jgi:FkbM family methyltransferase|nr:FkbM family methyltransferase [Verrucomicrobiota bacterium]